MRTRRFLQALSIAGSTVVVLIALTLVVTAPDQPMGALTAIGVTLLAFLGIRLLSKRVPKGTVLELDLDSGVVEQPPNQPLDRLLNRGAVVLRDVTDALGRAASDDRVAGLVVRVGNGALAVAQAQELREAVKAFRATGKRTVAFSESFGETRLSIADYYLAAAFEEIHLMPMGNLAIEGVISRTPFLRGALDRLDVEPDFGHRREYKAFKYLFTEKDYVPPHEEATKAILEDHLDQMVRGIAEDRSLEPATVRDLVDRAPLFDREALEEGLVDAISHRDEAYESARADGQGFMYVKEYLKRAGRPNRRGRKIALIYGTGRIHRGSSGFDPLERSSSMGADDVASAFREAREDKRVEAIVFRVDSPGGSAVASEVIHREVVRAGEAGKPVVVSMGAVAGSGGYFVAAPAVRIVAQPATITGSIGVIMGKLVTGEAWRRLGVNWAHLQVGQNATYSIPDDTYTETERERLESGLDVVYEGFKERVSQGRSLTIDRVEEVAKGRVWTGERAAELGLVDDLGGLDRAIETARELAEIDPGASVKVQVFPRSRPLSLPRSKPSSEPVRELLAVLGALSPSAPIEMRMRGAWHR